MVNPNNMPGRSDPVKVTRRDGDLVCGYITPDGKPCDCWATGRNVWHPIVRESVPIKAIRPLGIRNRAMEHALRDAGYLEYLE